MGDPPPKKGKGPRRVPDDNDPPAMGLGRQQRTKGQFGKESTLPGSVAFKGKTPRQGGSRWLEMQQQGPGWKRRRRRKGIFPHHVATLGCSTCLPTS